ncbi:nicotinate-nucleotide--dimethylbenzimidazole phosphoribosyltransferase [Tropicibacter oceani]|uniref:Nicotinate-nucleotide--dimethylbenzimidazole phosphoribosyltransferase n=1 Tax=Tropicibacter oceani TaxID=3058420 RepID=A0ABY8QEL2_9RHOB|nr:nicotinate-nucleotide--dimethylbenzimidazole phosphoribosyltransferase [Tropicibacter oceani]WGW03074.1 nicotinate-nucleotide--dimethylbenzimidazole phosphoribosyltransferase [Tropicibacter oceani]
MNDFERRLQARIDGKTKPLGALGQVELLAAKVARLQGRLDPDMTRARLVIFAGDHGLAQEGVSAYPPDVTRQMVLNFAAGGAAANVFCRANGLDLAVVNAGVKGGPFDLPQVIEAAMGEGTANSLHGPAMSAATCQAAVETGYRLGAEGDWHAVAFGEMGIGNSSAAALVAHRLTDVPLQLLVGRGTGLDDDGLIQKHNILAQVSARVPGALGPMGALAEFGGFEIAMMTGAMLGAAEARKLVMVDGYIATAAALAAVTITPAARDAMVFCHVSGEPGHRVVLDTMGAKPLLQLGMRLGEGTGAALAWPLIRASVAMLNEMASFEEAGVSGAT